MFVMHFYPLVKLAPSNKIEVANGSQPTFLRARYKEVAFILIQFHRSKKNSLYGHLV